MFKLAKKETKRRPVRAWKLSPAQREKRKAETMEKGFTKMNAFFQKGIDLSSNDKTGFLKTLKNVFPRKSGKHPLDKKREVKYIHKNGDRGYQPNVMGKLVPRPYTLRGKY